MRINIPDYGALEVPNRLGVEEARRACVGLGLTQVQNATGRVEANGDVTFERATGGTKGL
jgi:hypothetical protein